MSLGIESVVDLHPDRRATAGSRIGSLKTNPVREDPRLPPGASYDATNHRFILAGDYTGARRVFSGWNCKDAAAYIEIIRPGWTISDCLCGPSKDGTGNLNVFNYPIKVSNALANAVRGDANSSTIIEHNTIDGLHTDGTYHIGSAGIIVQNVGVNGWIIRHNHLKNMGADGINGYGDDAVVEWNYISIGGKRSGAHFDHLQFFGGNNLHYHHNYLNSTPETVEHGRTNACRLEAFGGNNSITNARVEYNYCPGADLLDADRAAQYYLFSTSIYQSTGSLSNNRFDNNAVSYGISIIHPGSRGCSGTGNRRIKDNRVEPDFRL